MKFFEFLIDHKLISDYAPVFDWLFNDHKFDKSLWDNKNKIQAFTKAIHNLNGYKESDRQIDARKRLTFPTARPSHIPTVYMISSNSEGRDWIRHIRNGIAHGNVLAIEKGGQFILEIKDYGKDDGGGQTAYMLIPLDYLIQTYQIYNEKEKTWRRNPRKKKSISVNVAKSRKTA